MAASFGEAFDIGGTLSRGWNAFKAAPWPILLGALVMQCTEGGGPGGGGGGGDPPIPSDAGGSGGDPGASSWLPELSLPGAGRLDLDDLGDWLEAVPTPPLDGLGGGLGMGVAEALLIAAILLFAGVFVLCCSLVLFAFRTWVEVGYLRAQGEALRLGNTSFSTLFGGADAFWRLAGFKIVAGLLFLGVLILALIPGGLALGAGLYAELPLVWGAGIGLMVLLGLWLGIWVGLGLALGRHAVALEGRGVRDALRRSWELCRGHRLWLLVYLLVLGIVKLFGLCLCCFGIILTRAIADTAFTDAFLALTRPEDGGVPLAQKG